MTYNIGNIYSDFTMNFEDKPDFVIDYYTRYSIFFNNIKTFKDKEEVRLFIEINWHYLNAIYKKERFNDTVDSANKIKSLVDKEIERFNAIELKDDCYYGILLFKGMASYRLRDYKTSTLIFKTLTLFDNKNENYQNWLKHSIHSQRHWLTNTIYIVCILFIFTEMFFKFLITNYYVRQTLLGIGLLGLMCNWIYEYYINRSFRKTNNN